MADNRLEEFVSIEKTISDVSEIQKTSCPVCGHNQTPSEDHHCKSCDADFELI